MRRRLLLILLTLPVILILLAVLASQVTISLPLRITEEQITERLVTQGNRIEHVEFHDNYMLVQMQSQPTPMTLTLVPVLREGRVAFDLIAVNDAPPTSGLLNRQADTFTDRFGQTFDSQMGVIDGADLQGVGVRTGYLELRISTNLLESISRRLSGGG